MHRGHRGHRPRSPWCLCPLCLARADQRAGHCTPFSGRRLSGQTKPPARVPASWTRRDAMNCRPRPCGSRNDSLQMMTFARDHALRSLLVMAARRGRPTEGRRGLRSIPRRVRGSIPNRGRGAKISGTISKIRLGIQWDIAETWDTISAWRCSTISARPWAPLSLVIDIAKYFRAFPTLRKAGIAPSRRSSPLIGAERTSLQRVRNDANDPKQT
jgi:hypothetical protein